MRFAKGTFAVAMTLFIAGATGLLGVWAVSVSCVGLLLAGVAGAIAMEERDFAVQHDLTAVEGLLPSSAPAYDLSDVPAPEPAPALAEAV